MAAFTTALVPIMVLIFLGYGLKQSKFLADEAWSGIEKLTYYILFPALLIHTLGNQTLVGGCTLAFYADGCCWHIDDISDGTYLLASDSSI